MEQRLYLVSDAEKDAFFAMTQEEQHQHIRKTNRAAWRRNNEAQKMAQKASQEEWEAKYGGLTYEQILEKQGNEFREAIKQEREEQRRSDLFEISYLAAMGKAGTEARQRSEEFIASIEQHQPQGESPDALNVEIVFERGDKTVTLTPAPGIEHQFEVTRANLPSINVLLFVVPGGLAFQTTAGRWLALKVELNPELTEGINARNKRRNWKPPIELLTRFSDEIKEHKPLLPASLPHPTFMEARQFAGAISDGRDGRYWGEIPGAVALLHCPPKSKLETRYEPGAMMLNWWGVPSAQPQTLYDELARLDFDDVILFQVVLSAILHTEKARCSNVSLDWIIKLIGRDTDARRSSETRQKWRSKVWRSLVLFDSMAVCGTRPGVWREPGARGPRRPKMDAQTLYSRDPLIRIVGTRDTEQGTFDGSAPPKEVSIVPGDWLMQFHGNREFLSEMGNVLQIAQISRGKPSGAWAACAGLMLNQLWREGATRATKGRNSRGKETKTEVLKFRPFTRRELLADTVRSDYDVNVILNDPKNRSERVKSYWKEAVKELKKADIIGHYTELKPKPGEDWREEWLDQRLDIRPVGEPLENALAIHDTAIKARRQSTPRAKPKQAPESDG